MFAKKWGKQMQAASHEVIKEMILKGMRSCL